MCRIRPTRVEPTIPWPPRPTGDPVRDASRMEQWRRQRDKEIRQHEKRWDKRRHVLLVVMLAVFCAGGMWLSGRRKAAEQQRIADIEHRLEELEDACLPRGGWL